MEIGHQRQALASAEIFDLIRDDLRGVEKAIGVESVTCSDTVRSISDHLPQNGRIHLRAALLLLCARFSGGGGRMAIQLGAAVEMMHAAALIHRDILGTENIHLGNTQANTQQDNCTRLLAGDWLYLGAFRVAQQERVLHLVIGVAQKMVAADLIQLGRVGTIGVTEADCMALVEGKTACLFSVCGTLGAISAGTDTPNAAKLAEFAWNLGMAAQLIDDMLNFVGNGTAAGGDLRNGKVTLPLAYALEDATECERNLVVRVLRDRSYDTIPFASVLALLDRYRGIERTRARAEQFVVCAREIMSDFPDNDCRNALCRLTDLIMERDC